MLIHSASKRVFSFISLLHLHKSCKKFGPMQAIRMIVQVAIQTQVCWTLITQRIALSRYLRDEGTRYQLRYFDTFHNFT